MLAKLHETIHFESSQVMCVSNATKEHETDVRTAAFVLPVGRVAEAIKSRGLWL